ncbi:MAG: rRNA pseudouridine synthase [Deltaproteobacteria bacterium]|nr:rRNA pseudouridine synthase [Candidatus Anaeroferrophillacea bacterium]
MAEERLQKIIAAHGIASRRAAERLILAGRVTVNGVTVTELGTRADPAAAEIAVDGRPLPPQATPRRRVILLNKPPGCVSTMKDPDGRPTVRDLLRDIPERLYPVGRLDFFSEGLLLCTNNGDLANGLMHPRYKMEKTYRVTVTGHIAPETLTRLRHGVMLEDGMSKPLKVRLVEVGERQSVVDIVLGEGRNRQVRRMLATLGLGIRRLVRIAYGPLTLEGVAPGRWRELQAGEIRTLNRSASLPRQ